MANVPRHIAIIMDGNGRWAQQQRMPRIAGHRAGVESVRRIIQLAADKGIETLTLFAFSSENWRRPKTEVTLLMELFLNSLQREARKLQESNVNLRIIGNRQALTANLRKQINYVEQLTGGNNGLRLIIAANYGGRWDLVEATKKIAVAVARGEIEAAEVDERSMASALSLADVPDPDLFIRTGGERRVSNFLLWHLAYTELYFTETLWPAFDAAAFEEALASYSRRQRRFGQTREQVEQVQGA